MLSETVKLTAIFKSFRKRKKNGKTKIVKTPKGVFPTLSPRRFTANQNGEGFITRGRKSVRAMWDTLSIWGACITVDYCVFPGCFRFNFKPLQTLTIL